VSTGHLCEAEAPTEPAGETYPPIQHNLIGCFVGTLQEASE